MSAKRNNTPNTLRGVGSLTIDAVHGVVDIVEALHQTISAAPGPFGSNDNERTGGITGLVYRNIRLTTGAVGGSLDALLGSLADRFEDRASSDGREAALAALNGYIGDHLQAGHNPLALDMVLRHDGRPITRWPAVTSLQSSQMVILVHGAFMNDRQWLRNGHDHGAALARDNGSTPLYLHYNSGLHISENGRRFADLLESLTIDETQTLDLVIIGYSMGGLVARSACHYGLQAGHRWLDSLSKLIFLGTPHHGAPLERGGNRLNSLLHISPYSAPFVRLGRARSSGLTDLRYGTLLEQDWHGRDRFDVGGDRRTPVPLPVGVSCYALAATTGRLGPQACDEWLGDGLVPLNSALGRHERPELQLGIPDEQQWIGRELNHLDLLDHPAVYAVLKQCLAPIAAA